MQSFATTNRFFVQQGSEDEMWCRVCEHFGNPAHVCATHSTKTETDMAAVDRVTQADYMILRSITGSTQCPCLQQTICPNRNCFNHGSVTEPTLGHARSYCPCAWDQEIPAWEAKQEQERLLCEAKELQQQQQQQMQQMHQNHMAWLQAQMGCVPPPPPMTQEMIDSHFDPDQVAVENFLEEWDEAELDDVQTQFAHDVANDDWLDTEESIAAAEEYLAEKEQERLAQELRLVDSESEEQKRLAEEHRLAEIEQERLAEEHRLADSEGDEQERMVEELHKIQFQPKSWDSEDEEMDYDEENIFDEPTPLLVRTDSCRDEVNTVGSSEEVQSPNPVTATDPQLAGLELQIDEQNSRLADLKTKANGSDGWTSMPTQKKIRIVQENIDSLQREYQDRRNLTSWKSQYGYLDGENRGDWLQRMGQIEGKIPCLCTSIQNGTKCRHDMIHGVGACKFLHITLCSPIRTALVRDEESVQKQPKKQKASPHQEEQCWGGSAFAALFHSDEESEE